MAKRKSHPLFIVALTGATLLLILICFNIFAPNKWTGAIKWLNLSAGSIIVGIAIFFCAYAVSKPIRSGRGRMIWLWLAVICAIFGAIPFIMPNYTILRWPYQYFISLCWALALLAGALALFSGAAKKGAMASSLLCLAGSVGFALAAGELYFLLTAQQADGIADRSEESGYATDGVTPAYENWSPFICGMQPSAPGVEKRAGHRVTRYGKDLFDTRYSFDKNGWRIMPARNANAENNLILFGCSFTFGYGLEDEQTWPWRLAKLLGPDWKLENYSAIGYSANQMLCMLEHNLIAPPEGKHRYALFLALNFHLMRNDFYPFSPHYELDANGEAKAGGKPKYAWMNNLPFTFNGSQLAREISSSLINRAMADTSEMLGGYLAMIKKSADILKQKYDTQLVIMLWPDFEYAKAEFEKLGLPLLMARDFLPDWEKGDWPGSVYYIAPRYDNHPNSKATEEIAEGLARWFEKRAAGAQPVATAQATPQIAH